MTAMLLDTILYSPLVLEGERTTLDFTDKVGREVSVALSESGQVRGF